MKKKLKCLDGKKILSFVMCFILIFNLGISDCFREKADAAVTEDPNRQLTSTDIPDTVLLNKLTELADTDNDKKLTILELQSYKGDSNGVLNLSNLDLSTIQGLGYAKGVTSIDLSGNNRLTKVPAGTFKKCTKLASIKLPDTITTLEDSSFDSCSSLKDINLPNGVTTIGKECFDQCTSLTGIVLPATISTIDDSAFSGSGLTSIEIPNPNVTIGTSCFNACYNLTDVKLPDGMETISTECFKSTGIQTISIPKSMKNIGSGAFSCSGLNSIDLSMCTNLNEIGNDAFTNTPISNVVFPESLTQLGSSAFENCKNLRQVNIPSKIAVINKYTFCNCTSLEKLTFTPTETVNGISNYKLQEIGDFAFYECSGIGGTDGNVDFLKDLNNLTTIGEQAFAYCSKPKGEVDEYGQLEYCGLKNIILPNDINTIGTGAFLKCNALTSIIIPDKVTVINDNVFLDCYNLQNVTLPKALTSIGSNSFEACKSLNNITFPESLTQIGSNAFLNCANERVKTVVDTITGLKGNQYSYTGIDTLVLPDSLTDIGPGAFEGCFNLKTAQLPANFTQLGDSIFEDCGMELKNSDGTTNGFYMGLKSVVMPKNLTSIGSSTFRDCYNLNFTDGILPNSLNTIGNNSFDSCRSLTSVVIPFNLKAIGSSAFSNCSALGQVDFSFAGNLTEIDALAFKNAGIKGTLSLPDGITKIESSVFEGCSGITKVEFPDTLTSIGNSSFKDCQSLLTVQMPAQATMVSSGYYSSFLGCNRFSNAIINPAPKKVIAMENSQMVLPINCFQEIDPKDIVVGDENIATAQLDSSSGKPQVILKGLKTGTTTITVQGTIEYVVGKDPITGITLVNRFQSQVEFDVEISAVKCTQVKFDQPIRGLRLDNTDGITLKPTIAPANTTDLQKWSSDNTSVATVSDTGVVKPVSYGTATIKLTVGDQEAQCIINVCAPANSVSIDKSNETLVIGKEMTITPTLNYLDTYSDIKTNYPDVVLWSSSNPAVATVDQNGNVKAIASGETKIIAKADAGDVISVCYVTVIPEVTNVSFDKNNITLIKGDAKQGSDIITMTLDPPDSPLSKIKVTSDKLYVAVVSVTGNTLRVTAIGGGTATITATPVNGTPAICKVTVNSHVTSITTRPMKLNKGASNTIAQTITPSDYTDTIVYSSDNSGVATVDASGKVTGVSGGTANITVKTQDGLVSSICPVTVDVPVTGVNFQNTSTTLIKNTKYDLSKIATVQPNDATNKALTWNSSDSSVATVDANGVVTAVGRGTATITVRTLGVDINGYNSTATYTITVELPSLGGKSFDVNNDGKIDITDLGLVAKFYNMKSESTGFDPKYDLNSDDIVDIYDLVQIARYMD